MHEAVGAQRELLGVLWREETKVTLLDALQAEAAYESKFKKLPFGLGEKTASPANDRDH